MLMEMIVIIKYVVDTHTIHLSLKHTYPLRHDHKAEYQCQL